MTLMARRDDYVVKDIGLADFGRKEISIAAVSYTHLTLPTIYSV